MAANKEIVDLLSKALENGISVFQEEQKLKFKVAKDKIADSKIIDLLKVNKQEILAFLNHSMGDIHEIRTVEKKITPFDRSVPQRIPLSFSQERLWFIDQLQGSVQYHIPTILRLRNELDRSLLESALSALINRHEVLRTVIKSDNGQPYQEFLTADGWKMQYTASENGISEAALKQLIADEINRPFDLAADYMLRAHLIHCAEKEHVLILVIHHIASDGWSNGILVRDLMEFYRAKQEGDPPRLAELPIQYADYAFWQRKYISGDYLKAQIEWWNQKLQGLVPLELPTDFPRPATQSTRGAGMAVQIPKSLAASLNALALATDTTLFMVLLAAFKVLMYRYSGQEDICIGTPLANRNQKEVESLVGFFINTLALRSDLSGNPDFYQLLERIKDTTLTAFAHQKAPFEQIVEKVVSGRSLSHSPIFQVMFILQNAPDTPNLELGEVSLSAESTERTSTLFDLIFSVTEEKNGLLLKIVYCSDLFSQATVSRMATHFQILLQEIVHNPLKKIAHLPLLPPEEKQQLFNEFNDTKVSWPAGKTVLDLFENQVTLSPDRTALVFEAHAYDYNTLNRLSNQLAKYLLNETAFQCGDCVAVFMERSEWSVVAMIGIMKAGGVYVPVNTTYPEERIHFIFRNSGAKIALINGGEVLSNSSELPANLLDVNSGELFRHCESHRVSAEMPLNGASFVIYTSGSTGMPKGVEQTHLMLYNLIMWTIHQSGQVKGSRYLQYASFSFDMSLYEIYYALSTGGTVYVCPENLRRDLWGLKDYILQQGIEVISMPYSALKLIFGELGKSGFEGHQIREIISAGEQLYISGGLRTFLRSNPQVKIHNLYGPSETHVITGIDYQFETGEPPVEASIGRPVSNTTIYILDQELQPVPIGVAGEIYAGGDNVALGYINDPERTAGKFIDDPFKPGERVYRTGDLGRWLPDGSIRFSGRRDDQIKIRGFRVEPGEIESVIKKTEAVKSCAVIASKNAEGDLRIAAFVVPEEKYDRAALQALLHEKLPEYMVPALWMEMEALPLNSNGKVNRLALAAMELAVESTREYVAPQTPTEQILAAIWQELLHLDKVSIHDNFFEIGGHSLMAMRVVSAIRQKCSREIKVLEIFTHPDIAGLAKYIDSLEEATLLPPISAGPRPKRIPLSYAQERLWFIDQFGGSTQYHLPSVLRLKRNLDRNLLESSILALVERHEVLRTVIKSENGVAYQEVMPPDNWRLAYSEGASFASETYLREFIASETARPFNLSTDYMLRAHLVRCEENDHVLILVMHHIATDGWSNSLLINDLVATYSAYQEGKKPNLPELPIQYADFAIWQRKHLSDSYLEGQLDWWATQLQGIEPLLLPTDFPRPEQQSIRGGGEVLYIEKELADALKSLSLKSGATLYMTLLAAFNVLLHRYSGQEDICIGMPIANREQKEIESLVGFFINTLVLRADLSGNPSFKNLLEQVKSTALSAFAHQSVPFEKIVEKVASNRTMSYNPLFQVLMVLQNTPDSADLELGDLDLSAESSVGITAQFDLAMSIQEGPKGLKIAITYRADLFAATTIKRMARHFKNILSQLDPAFELPLDHIKLLTPDEELMLIEKFNQPWVPYSKPQTLLAQFEHQVVLNPDRVAAVMASHSLTYAELESRANRWAHLLIDQGVKPHNIVGICVERSLDMITGILAIFKAGAAYLPIDPRYPEARIAFFLEDAGIRHVLTHEVNVAKFPASSPVQLILMDAEEIHLSAFPGSPPGLTVAPADPAYVIYTSGSTGEPKGVLMSHGGVVNQSHWAQDHFGLTPDDAVLQSTTFCFDPSIWELFWPLSSGGKICFALPGMEADARYLIDAMAQNQITIGSLVPSMLSVFLQEIKQGECPSLKRIICGGEVLHKQLVELFRKKLPHATLHNHYGPTETAIHVSSYEVPENLDNLASVPIGKPFPNVRFFITDKGGNLVPEGVVGELCIGGVQLAREYLGQPALTQQKFKAPAFENSGVDRLYHTGDLVRWLPDGNVEYIGRRDNQVKISGFRVELNEIEHLLTQAPGVYAAIVDAKKGPDGNNRLIAYIVPKGQYDQPLIENYLKAKVPAHMVPAFWIEIDKIPVSPTGKVNRKALPEPDISALIEKHHVAPESASEILLAQLWMDLLHLEKIGVHDNFFVIGGHSLMAMRMVSAIRESFHKELKVKDIFSYPTIEELARYLDSQEGGTALLQLISGPRPDKIPLSFAQERLWFIDQFGGSTQYHMPTILRLKNGLDKNSLAAALKALVNRHETLRTVFKSDDGQAYQYLLGAENWTLRQFEGAAYEDDTQLNAFIREEINRPFDLSKDYMLRAALVKCAGEDHVLILVVHHIASDGWSQSLLVNDLAEFYSAIKENREVGLPPLEFHYADYAVWQREYLSKSVLSAQLNWWAQQLAGVEPLSLPFDFPRPSVQRHQGGNMVFRIDKDLTGQLHALSEKPGASLFMTLLAAFKVLLYRYSGQEDICVGTPVANRNFKALEPVVGFFINTIALRSNMAGNPAFSSLLETIKTTTLDAFAHQEVPFEQIVERVETDRSLSRSPVFQVMFVMQNMPDSPDLQLGDTSLASEALPQTRSLFDLTFSVRESPRGLLIAIEYSSDLFLPQTIQQMAIHYQTLLKAIVANPAESIADLPMMESEEESQLIYGFNDTTVHFNNPDGILDLFQKQVDLSPGHTAIVFDGKYISYQTLDEESGKLAHYLIEQYNIRPNDFVGVMMERSDQAIIAILGILKSGACYVPVDTQYPFERKAFMVSDTRLRVLITVSGQAEEAVQLGAPVCVLDQEAETWAHSPHTSRVKRNSNDLAYVIYTSGSTGKPKGVMVEDGSLLNYLFYGMQAYRQSEQPFSFPLFTSLAFDLTQTSIFLTLLSGGQLLIENEKDIDVALERIVRNAAINTIKLTPSHINFLEGKTNAGIAVAIVGGEQLELQQVKLLKAMNPGIRIFNEYGPTEATIGCTVHEIKDLDSTPLIGKPIANTSIFLLDEAGQLVPRGVPGEICIGGDCLARGYLNRPDLNLERFIPNPWSQKQDAKIYRTGDIGRWRWDGNLEYRGRKDNQVKIRGYRIELGEIESVLSGISGVKSCAVVAKPAPGGGLVLAAYLVFEGVFDKNRIQEYLSQKLPDYMVPAIWENLQALPLTNAGKIDRKALETRNISAEVKLDFIAPKNRTEQIIAKIWQESLELKAVSIHDNFFEIGGHSLNAIPIVFKMNKSLNVNLKLMDLFANPTIEKIARMLILQETGSENIYALNSIQKNLPNLFFIPPVLGIPIVFKNLAISLAGKFNCYGIQYRGIDKNDDLDANIGQMANGFINDILSIQQHGVFQLCGYSMGATIAYEMAKKLEDMGFETRLVLLDRGVRRTEGITAEKIDTHAEFHLNWMNRELVAASLKSKDDPRIKQFLLHNIRILNEYIVEGQIKGPIFAIEAQNDKMQSYMKEWAAFTSNTFGQAWVKGDHFDMLDPKYTPQIKMYLLQFLSSGRSSIKKSTITTIMKDLKLKLTNLALFVNQKISKSTPYWLNMDIKAREFITPNFKLGQFFFTEETAKALVEKLDRFEHPCCLCTPSLGNEWHKKGKEVRVLDIDKRFDFLPGYRYYDLRKPEYLNETYDVIILDPIFFPPEFLLRVINVLTRNNYNQRLLIVYKTSMEKHFLEVFEEYGVFPSNYYPDYPHVSEAGKKEFMFYANFEI